MLYINRLHAVSPGASSAAQLAVPHFCQSLEKTVQQAKVLMVRKEHELVAVSLMHYKW